MFSAHVRVTEVRPAEKKVVQWENTFDVPEEEKEGPHSLTRTNRNQKQKLKASLAKARKGRKVNLNPAF